ncbi:MAG TPA: arsenosugar biosynthesis radical SAM (seleno)protein ArsS [Saprospiraceae bacterium]|nr:arsenosugar biosynthesis radical SAM (seleno)protein ArsS [Saprospiraceae bacterium]
MSIKQKGKSLQKRESSFSDVSFQLKVLNQLLPDGRHFDSFSNKLKDFGYQGLKPGKIEIFQVNIGKLCNQTCAHCHVDAGPDRQENMSKVTLEKCLDLIKKYKFLKVDITGGAPEMNPNFRWFVEECSALRIEVMDRCNLTIIQSNKKYGDLPEFFAKHKVHVISSLPYFSKSRTDGQRGEGVFDDSILALQKLNAVGYGMPDSALILDLVYNPSGAFLPGNQSSLETEFKRQLGRKYNIQFNNLIAITNLPISRFLEYLVESENYEDYMQTLINAFNPATVEGLMCRNTLSISWDGYIYDCDFNQMLDLKVSSSTKHIDDFNLEELETRNIILNQHCYGCTAGAGSSCGGAIA